MNLLDYEQRLHGGLYDYRDRVGRTTATVDCPFCREMVRVFVWSFAGVGKRCGCGAVIGPVSARRKIKECLR